MNARSCRLKYANHWMQKQIKISGKNVINLFTYFKVDIFLLEHNIRAIFSPNRKPKLAK